MQAMSDKELDTLFQQKLANYEPEVSPVLWNRIDSELGKESVAVSGRKFPLIWMAAASVAIMVCCGIWLSLESVVQNQQKKPAESVVYTPENRPRVAAEPREVALDPDPAQVQTLRTLPAAARHIASQAEQPVALMQPEAREVNMPDASAPVPQPASHNDSPIPGKIDSVTVNSLAATAPLPGTPVLAAIPERPESEPEPSRPKIRSIGGLVNYVVGKVDKRDEKLIEFKDGENGSVVSGINLGLLKIRGKNGKHSNQ
jgi:hypothetical protein